MNKKPNFLILTYGGKEMMDMTQIGEEEAVASGELAMLFEQEKISALWVAAAVSARYANNRARRASAADARGRRQPMPGSVGARCPGASTASA